MIIKMFQVWITITVTSVFLMTGCGPSISANASPLSDRATTSASTTPMATTDWKLVVVRAHVESELAGFTLGGYSPDAGYTYLVVDVTLRNTSASQPTRLSTDAFSVIDAAGQSIPCIGIGYTKLSRYELASSHVLNSQGNSIDNLALVFAVNERQVGQPLEFQFRDAPRLALPLGE